MTTLIELADAHSDWAAPAYTHLQRAQPVYLGHHLLAYFWMFFRDARRFFAGRASRPATCPRGRAPWPASTGTSTARDWPPTSASSARTPTRSTPSPTATSPWTTSTRPRPARCTSRGWAAEIVLWSSQEFGFCEPADSFASGSSIMPQKKNPDAAELLRGKAPRIAASLASLLGTMHGLPLAYSKDMQEDKEPLFDAIDNLELCLEAATPMLARPAASTASALAEAAERRDAGRHRPRRRAGRARGSPSARPTAWSPAWSAPPWRPDKQLSELDDSQLDGVPEGARERLRDALRRGRDDRGEGLGRRNLVGAPGRAAGAGPQEPGGPR